MQSECNVGTKERTERIGAGALLMAVGMLAPVNRRLKIAAEALGAVGLATGIARFCPMNKLMGRNSCEVREPKVETQALSRVEQ